MDIRPAAPGHTLVIPKQEVDVFFDLSGTDLSGILPFAQPIAAALKQLFPCNRVGLLVAGLEVPHAHLHLIPMNSMADMDLANATAVDPVELEKQAEQIRALL